MHNKSQSISAPINISTLAVLLKFRSAITIVEGRRKLSKLTYTTGKLSLIFDITKNVNLTLYSL